MAPGQACCSQQLCQLTQLRPCGGLPSRAGQAAIRQHLLCQEHGCCKQQHVTAAHQHLFGGSNRRQTGAGLVSACACITAALKHQAQVCDRLHAERQAQPSRTHPLPGAYTGPAATNPVPSAPEVRQARARQRPPGVAALGAARAARRSAARRCSAAAGCARRTSKPPAATRPAGEDRHW